MQDLVTDKVVRNESRRKQNEFPPARNRRICEGQCLDRDRPAVTDRAIRRPRQRRIRTSDSGAGVESDRTYTGSMGIQVRCRHTGQNGNWRDR